MDDQIALFRAFLVKDARTRSRYVLDSAAGGEVPQIKITSEAAITRHLEYQLKELDLLSRNPQEFGEKHGFLTAKEPA